MFLGLSDNSESPFLMQYIFSFYPPKVFSASQAPQNLTAHSTSLASDRPFNHPEYSPHPGFYIPAKASGSIQIIPGASGAVFQFHIVSIAYADCALDRNLPGKTVFWLFLPQMAVNGKGYISGLICRHHGSENHPVSRICFPYRSFRFSVYFTAEDFPDPRILFQPVGKPL